MRPRTAWMLGATAGSAAFLAACAATPDGDAPDRRGSENVSLAAHTDQASLQQLVERLDADDVVVRMTAIRALEARTGETLDFDPNASRMERQAAQRRWIERIRGGDSFSPSSAASK